VSRQPLILEFGQYAALRAVSTVLNCFDPEQNLRTAATIGSLVYRSSRRHRERGQANIARSFPEWDPPRVAEVAERSMQYMFQLFLVDALIAARLVTRSSWPHRLHLSGIGPLVERLIQGRPIILLTGHCGNWELLGHALAVLGYPITALARPLDNRFINRWIMSIREAQGTRIITKWGAMPEVRRILTCNGRIGFIADQNAGEEGLFVPFFGRLASNYKSIGLLAMVHEVAIAAGAAHRIRGMEYALRLFDFIEPADWKDRPDPLFYITARYNRAMEQMIRAAPEQYLWVHRRWKSRPRHEREGRPMPRRLLEKLRALPWMSDEELGRIVEQSEREGRERVKRKA
jgi:KDO2-lipid IV(A) lauroyltransferase